MSVRGPTLHREENPTKRTTSPQTEINIMEPPACAVVVAPFVRSGVPEAEPEAEVAVVGLTAVVRLLETILEGAGATGEAVLPTGAGVAVVAEEA